MAVADIRNNAVRRVVITALTPVALVIYAAFGAAIYVCDYLIVDIKDAWRGAAVTHRLHRRPKEARHD